MSAIAGDIDMYRHIMRSMKSKADSFFPEFIIEKRSMIKPLYVWVKFQKTYDNLLL
jgi:hypothetical protein